MPNLGSHVKIPETLDFEGVTFTVKQIGSFAFTKYQDEGGAIAEGGSNVEIIELPKSITTIQPKAFYSSLDLRLIHFTPDSQLTTIGKDAFAFSGLSKISIPDSVVEIGANAFVFNEFLTAFQLSDTSSLQVIGDGALRTTRQLKHIYLPASLMSIGERPFSGAIGLQSITVSPENPNYSSIDGILFNKTQETLITYPADHDGHSYTVPETVSIIHDHAFEYDVNLKSLTLSDSVRHVGALAFKNMRKLETLHLNEGLTSVGRLSFYGINQLKELTLPNSLTEYRRNPLYDLDGLEQITIGTETTHLPANFLGRPFIQLHTITILGDEVTFDEDMFSFFDSTNWQNLKFFVTNENVRERLLESLMIEKEQVKLLESLPEDPITSTEPEETKQPESSDETNDVEQTEKRRALRLKHRLYQTKIKKTNHKKKLRRNLEKNKRIIKRLSRI
ncbi:leucine-rich repeat domain-containing protein [Vagococcus lutrae]|uniref:leucine-rich repeat domain-containing protein n=1 Tax=Vagococcus lutrae TaxID=81947 RepID=UPI00289DE7BA|nr:leucine-rich repeat domain-containing protein [Vagococcus lutrae]